MRGQKEERGRSYFREPQPSLLGYLRPTLRRTTEELRHEHVDPWEGRGERGVVLSPSNSPKVVNSVSTADALLTKPPTRTSGSSCFLRVLQEKYRADERTRTAFLLTTSELFLLEEQPAPHFLGLRPIYWSATKVKVGTICGYVLSNISRHKVPIRTQRSKTASSYGRRCGDGTPARVLSQARHTSSSELWVRTSENNPSASFGNVGIRNRSEAASHGVRYPRSDERSTRGAR